ncbi:hypothetical protein GUITHDRAFT_146197 [Guillardia theta CCMP2712]|uniref:Uncharacterized protein n=1 Tax=Guillardia theta (strain CCMP2712) TaxID=905079 RepID=L1IID9_GUITC|nr:hypothetical protein GUITHDRAFT_146197 [Guillardia theta CCMP2712]EKX35847.1 hypothetical protein GUITHDRAFT_146197 [Guillardia theta CCMP2712]|eukprot:XP_005822827.1 hypothetical protein GUITHDRAFT_146197 [Guillardia theta CCMP2712]
MHAASNDRGTSGMRYITEESSGHLSAITGRSLHATLRAAGTQATRPKKETKRAECRLCLIAVGLLGPYMSGKLIVIADLKRRSLLIAAEIGDTEFVSHLVKSGDCSVHDRDEFGRTALHLAAANGHIDTSNLLLSLGADLWAYDKHEMVFNLEKRCMTPRGQRYASNNDMSSHYTAFSPAKSESRGPDSVSKLVSPDSRAEQHRLYDRNSLSSPPMKNAWQTVCQTTEVETVKEISVNFPNTFDEHNSPIRLKYMLVPQRSNDGEENGYQHVVSYVDPLVLKDKSDIKAGDVLLKIGDISLQAAAKTGRDGKRDWHIFIFCCFLVLDPF